MESEAPNEVEIPRWVDDIGKDHTDFREFYITKGLGAGGTFGAAIWHLGMCEVNEKSESSWAVAPTYQHIIDPLIPTFVTVLTQLMGMEEGRDFTVTLSGFPNIKLLATNQKIWFKSANVPHRLVGANVSHLTGTEPGLWSETAFQKCFDRVRCPHARYTQKLLEGTPEGLGNGYELRANFDEGVNEEKNRVRVILETRDNPILKPGYIPMLEQNYEHDPEKLESYLSGRFVGFTKGSAYWKFTGRNIGFDLAIYRELPILFGWDFGVSPLAWVAGQKQPCSTRGGLFYHRFAALKESDGKKRGLFEACAEFIKVFGDFRNTPIHIYGGHDGYSGSWLTDGCAFDQIKRHLQPYFDTVEIKAAHSAPSVMDRLTPINTLYAYERAVIDSKCRNLIESMQKTNLKPGTWDLDKPTGKDKDKIAKDKSHFGDAWSEMLFQLSRSEDLTGLRNQQLSGFTGRL